MSGSFFRTDINARHRSVLTVEHSVSRHWNNCDSVEEGAAAANLVCCSSCGTVSRILDASRDLAGRSLLAGYWLAV